MPLDYSNRKIWAVQVAGFSAAQVGEDEGASTGVTIQLSAETNERLPGPRIDLGFVFPASHDMTLRELQGEALTTAAAILQRAARETAQSLAAAELKRREEDVLKDAD